MLDQPFKNANPVIKTIKKHDFSAYYVGGCIRDYLLEVEINDIDIATSALPEDIQKIFPKVIPVGIDHGTVLVRHNHVSYEVTTFRGEASYSDKQLPVSINDDLSRRDFTINALAMDESGEIIDLFNGEADIKNKVIKAVGSPVERFNEDPLRIIRALRFSSQFGFDIEAKTLMAMTELKPKITQLSIERITTEMIKFFTGDYFSQGVKYLLQTEVYQALPIFKENKELIEILSDNPKPFNQFSEVISYFHLLDESIGVNQWVKAWKVSNVIKNEASLLVASLNNYAHNGINVLLLYQLKTDLIHSFIFVVNLYFKDRLNAEDILIKKQSLVIKSRKELEIDGNDITKLFPHLKKGKWIEDLIKRIEKEVLYKRLTNDKIIIKEWIKCNRLEIN